MSENDAEGLRATYQAISQGGNAPQLVVMNGAVLNELLNVTTYDVNAAYVVTEDGIEVLEEEW